MNGRSILYSGYFSRLSLRFSFFLPNIEQKQYMNNFFIKNQSFFAYFILLFIILSLGFFIVLQQDQILVLNQDLELLLKAQSTEELCKNTPKEITLSVSVSLPVFIIISILTYILVCPF